MERYAGSARTLVLSFAILWSACFCSGTMAEGAGGQNELSQNLDPVFFVTPKNWQLDQSKTTTYEYAFVATSTDAQVFFNILVRRLNVPAQGARAWAEDEFSYALAHGASPGKALEQATIGKITWYVIETIKPVTVQGRPKPLEMAVRQYFSKTAGSNTVVEVAVVAPAGMSNASFEASFKDFLSSFKLGPDVDGVFAKSMLKDKDYFGTGAAVGQLRQAFVAGNSYFSAQDYDSAIRVFEELLPLAASAAMKADVLYLLSCCYTEKGMLTAVKKDFAFLRKALGYAEEALKVKPNLWYVLGNMGIVYTALKDYKNADICYTKAEKYGDQSRPEYKDIVVKHVFAKAMLDNASAADGKGSPGKKPGEGTQGAAAAGPTYKIEGIMYSKKDPEVIINGEIYKLSQQVGPGTITKITADRVTITAGGEERVYQPGEAIK